MVRSLQADRSTQGEVVAPPSSASPSHRWPGVERSHVSLEGGGTLPGHRALGPECLTAEHMG